jgi:acetyltransferase-like isoleucine patch superfamily enzyme
MDIFNKMKYSNIDTWDYQWCICQWNNSAINVVPNVNLVSNIGFDHRATHTKSEGDRLANIETKSLQKIIHPSEIKINRKADLYSFHNSFNFKEKGSLKNHLVTTIKKPIDLIKSKISKKIVNFLKYHFELKRNNLQNNSNNPYNINFEANSFIESPKKIDNGNCISFGENTSVGFDGWIGAIKNYGLQKFNPKVIFEKNVRVGNYCCVTAIDKIVIKEGTLCSEYLYVSDHYHGTDPSLQISPAKQPLFSKGPVEIGKNCFIGYRVSILSGVKLGDYCVVGAHSVVNKSFPDYSMVAGSPAKLIKRYSLEEKKWIEI